jgi:hypothetical protein
MSDEIDKSKFTCGDDEEMCWGVELLKEQLAAKEKECEELNEIIVGMVAQKKSALNLLAVIHMDGGYHTEKVGFVQSCLDAETTRNALVLRIGNLELECAELRKNSDRYLFWRDHVEPNDIQEMIHTTSNKTDETVDRAMQLWEEEQEKRAAYDKYEKERNRDR